MLLKLDPDGVLRRGETWRYHVQPFPGARLDPASLAVNGIDPHHPLRPALPERDALQAAVQGGAHRDHATRTARARSWLATTRPSTSAS